MDIVGYGSPRRGDDAWCGALTRDLRCGAQWIAYEMPKIKVHERALAHLSRGLYRSPASALRELVSNAWDANATEVSIDTNYPHFFQLSVQDNGDGLRCALLASLLLPSNL